MHFNSYLFLFLFLPITLLGFHLIGSRGHHRVAISWLVGTSLFFYGWWNPSYLGLILISVLFNYAIGISLLGKSRKSTLIVGITANLAMLGYFKYANFFIENINLLTDSDIILQQIILPLAISFFTFQQITYLVDAYRSETKEYDFLHYCLFVTFFPQLIAGPIVHHKEMLPQFEKDSLYKITAKNLAIGFTIFFIGLFKKIILADGMVAYVAPAFTAAGNGTEFAFLEAWSAALAYTFQLYFDFSGYSDMAVGIALMFGVKLPINFLSPYKANSIIDFWKRWHITLSQFLRDYLYIPLGGNKKGSFRRYINIMITMLLGGLWHGAGWTFIAWGVLHGIFLVINHGWLRLKKKILGQYNSRIKFSGVIIGRLITFSIVVIAWVLFRAENMDAAVKLFEGMIGLNGLSGLGQTEKMQGSLLIFLLVVVWFAPNTYEIVSRTHNIEKINAKNSTQYSGSLHWAPSIGWSIVISLLALLSVLQMHDINDFIYYNF